MIRIVDVCCMNILFVNEFRVKSGAEVIVFNLMKYMSENGHNVKLITYDDLKDNIRSSFVGVLNDFCPDIVHFHNITRIGLDPIRICVFKNIPCLLTLHDYYIVCRNRTYYRWDKKELCDAFDWSDCENCRNIVLNLPCSSDIFEVLKNVLIVCISKKQESIIRRFSYINTCVIYNGVNYDNK